MSTVIEDLVTVQGVQAYLEGYPEFASHTVVKLAGGMGNFTYRIHLLRALADRQTLVLKYAPPYVASWGESFPLDQKRQVSTNLARLSCHADIRISISKYKHSVSQVSCP